jgi:hypothetical protein
MADLGTAVRGYLAANSGVAAAVGTRIYPDVLPQGYSVKAGGALTYTIIPGTHDHLLNGLAGIGRNRIEFAAFASTRAGANLIEQAVKKSGLIGFTGAMGGMLIESVTYDGGPETRDEGPTDGSQEHRYLTIFDFMFAYQEDT